ncbi:MAG: NAD-dependent deacylase [Ignavibacteriales bacterium]|nr:NAD-dependent deacylase [Ignavibacteriales bacterium]
MTFSENLISTLKNAESICVLTGAGISAESGVPTFRGEEGLWKKFKPEELANFDAFICNPDLVWEWYAYRRRLIHEVKPNPAHYALVALEHFANNFTLVTQNVDNLHRRAGSKNVLELHGNIERSYCIQCRALAPDAVPEGPTGVQRCTKCGGLVRPDVVWFGEMLPLEVFSKAESAARQCDIFFSIGTSAVVYPAASLPYTALDHGAFVVEMNLESTDLSSRAHEVLTGKVGEILPDLLLQAGIQLQGEQ